MILATTNGTKSLCKAIEFLALSLSFAKICQIIVYIFIVCKRETYTIKLRDENTDEENNKYFPTVSFEYKKKNDARFDVIDKMPEKTFWSIG